MAEKNFKTDEQIREECTHNCSTCMNNCTGGEGKINKALDALKDIKEDDLLKALQGLVDEGIV